MVLLEALAQAVSYTDNVRIKRGTGHVGMEILRSLESTLLRRVAS